MTLHATAVAINGRAVLLRGPSGAGKSDVALRLLALPVAALGAFGIARLEVGLVADDRVATAVVAGQLMASAPAALRGMIEVRGIGIVAVTPMAGLVPVGLVVDLTNDVANDVARMPDPAQIWLDGVAVRRLALSPFEASTPLKIALALLQVATVGTVATGPSRQHPSE